MQTAAKQRETHKKLGFTYLETAEIAVALRRLLANYQVHYHKLRQFHWNIEGADFFELHDKFEEDYTLAVEQIDTLAERIRAFGLPVDMSIQETLELAEIKDTPKARTAMDMVRQILGDYEILHNCMLDVLTASLDNGDTATEYMVSGFIRGLEKRNWMYTSWCK